MKKSRDIINKKLIPEISSNKGKVAMSHRLGGTLASSYNSSDVYNFNVKEEGDIIVADPERSYLTTTLYPISYKDALTSSLYDRITGRFTDNLYASLGDAENYAIIRPSNVSGLFKVALLQYQYSRTLTNYDSEAFRVMPKSVTGILRDVLKKYEKYAVENMLVKATKLTMSMRSVLIKYQYYAPETVRLYPDKLIVSSSVTLSGTFESFIPFDAENRIVAEVVPSHSEITDKASVTWSKTGSPVVQNSVSKEGAYALYLNGEGTSIKSQESLEYVPSDNESLIIENWLKPDNITTSLLTRYGSTNLEKGMYYDFSQNTNWIGNNVNNNEHAQSYVFDGTDQSYHLSNSNVSALTFKTATNSPNGQTLELNVRVKNSSATYPIILLSNQSTTWQQGPSGNSAAIVYYGNNHSNSSYAGRVAVITDNTTNATESNGIFLLSSTRFDEDSILRIAVVTYGNYIRLFVNGKLEAYAILNTVLNFSYLGSYINKAKWSTTPPDMFYRLYALRFTNFALYISNYTPSSVYSPRAIPKIKSLSNTFTYPEGIACGIRYLANTNTESNDKTIIYASLSDGENVYTAESTPIDPSKWNHIKMSIYKNTIVLYVNGIAYSSEIIPFDIELESISVGSSSNTNSTQSFSGYIDNFKMYKDETFDLEGVKYLEMRPWLNGIANIAMEDFNPEIQWKSVTTPSIVTQAGTSDILGYMIDCATNPKIYAEGLSVDTQNFGIRTYIYNTTSYTGTIFKKGASVIAVEGTTLKVTLNGSDYIQTAISLNTLYKIDIRYNRGLLKLSINGTEVGDGIETTINTLGTLYYGWDGATSLYKGKLGPVSIFDNNRNRIPALDMLISDYTTEAYYKNTVFSLLARDNVYDKEDCLFFDNGYSTVLNDVVMTGSVVNSTVENGFYIPKGSYFKVPSNQNFVFGKEDFTLEFSVKTSVTDRRQVVLDRYYNGSGSWQVSINYDGNIYFTVTDSNTSPYYYFLQTTNQLVNDGDWHKIFIIRQALELSIYVDNKLADRFGMTSVFDFNASKDFYIGHQGSNNNTEYDFEGYLNNIRITKGSVINEDIRNDWYADEYALVLPDGLFRTGVPNSFVAPGQLSSSWINNGIVFDVTENSPFGSEQSGSLKVTNTSTTASTNVSLGNTWVMSFDMKMPYGVGTGYGVPIMTLGSGSEGSGGFALEHFRWNANEPTLVIRNAYSTLSGIPMPFNEWFEVTVKLSNGVLTLTALGQSCTISTGVNYNSELPLILGTYSGQWLTSAPFFIDNFRIIKNASEAPYFTTILRDPFDDPIIEEYSPTSYTGNSVMLRTFDATVLGDTITTNTWTQTGTSISNSVSLKSGGSLHVPQGSSQSCSGSQFILTKAKDFCLEFSVYLLSDTGDNQVVFSRGNSIGTLSYAACINAGLGALRLICYHDGSGGNATSVQVPYKFQTERWYEVAICCKSGVIYFIINGVYYKPVTQLTSDFYQGSATTNVYVGRLGDSGYASYFNGYIDSLKLTTNTSVYSKGFGEDASYMRTHIDASSNNVNTQSSAITSVADYGVKPLTFDTARVLIEKEIVQKESLKSYAFSNTSFIKDQSGALSTFFEKPFSISASLYIPSSVSGTKYVLKSSDTDKVTLDISIIEGNKVKVDFKQNSEVIKTLTSSSGVPLGKWFTLGLVRTAQNVCRIYVNGYTVATLNNVTESIDCTGYPVTIGAESNSFIGYLSSFKVYANHVVIPKAGDNVLYITFNESNIYGSMLTDAENDYLKYQHQNVNFDYGIDGKYTASGYFNGLTSYLKLPILSKLDFGNLDFDIEFEIFPTDGTNKYQTLLSNSDSSNPYMIWMYGSNVETNNNRIAIGSSVDNPTLVSTSTISFEKWTMVRIARDDTLLRIYINGVLDSTLILTDNVFNLCSDSAMYVGRSYTSVENTFFKGYLSSFRASIGDIVRTINTSKFKVLSALDFENNQTDLVIYDYDLNMERLDKFRNTWTTIKYSSTTPDPVLQTITSSNEAVKLYRNGFICQNKHTHVSFKEFTIETKFMLTATNMPNWRRLIDQTGLYAINITADKRIEFNGGSVVLQSPANAVVVNKWHHVAVTRDSNMVTRLFLDGIKIGESSARVNYSEANHYPLCLGMYYSYYTNSSYVNYHFEGYMDNFYMVNGVCKYTNNFVPNIPSDTVINNTSLAFVNGTVFVDKNTDVTWTASGFTASTNKVKNKERAMYSSTTTGYIQSTYNEKFKPGYKDFTLDFIISPLQILAATTLFDNRTDATLASGLIITQPTGNTASFTLSIGPTTGTTDWAISLNTGINSIEAGKYYHLRVTRNLGKIYLFLNGTLKASADYIYEVPSSGVFVLGNRVNKNQGFTGYIEQFRYVDNTSLAGTTFATFTQELI